MHNNIKQIAENMIIKNIFKSNIKTGNNNINMDLPLSFSKISV